jgi:6-phosphogluconolactonase/glucosamine-6-phosphate isomerase/deaminase
VALSGGRIARQFFAAIAERAKQRKISMAIVHFFWADERCVPPTDPESSYGIADRGLFKPLEIRPDQVHRIRGEDDPKKAAAQATEEIKRIISCNVTSQPVLDFIFLGMGEDGIAFPRGTGRAGQCRRRLSSRRCYKTSTATDHAGLRANCGWQGGQRLTVARRRHAVS